MKRGVADVATKWKTKWPEWITGGKCHDGAPWLLGWRWQRTCRPPNQRGCGNGGNGVGRWRQVWHRMAIRRLNGARRRICGGQPACPGLVTPPPLSGVTWCSLRPLCHKEQRLSRRRIRTLAPTTTCRLPGLINFLGSRTVDQPVNCCGRELSPKNFRTKVGTTRVAWRLTRQ